MIAASPVASPEDRQLAIAVRVAAAVLLAMAVGMTLPALRVAHPHFQDVIVALAPWSAAIWLFVFVAWSVPRLAYGPSAKRTLCVAFVAIAFARLAIFLARVNEPGYLHVQRPVEIVATLAEAGATCFWIVGMAPWVRAEWQAIHDESFPTEEARIAVTGRVDLRPLIILATVAVSLTLQQYYGDRDYFANHYPSKGSLLTSYWELKSFIWWTGWRVGGYLVLPMIVVLCMPGERLRDYGWSMRGFVRHLPIYAGLYLAVLPVLYAVSYTRPFQAIYPFYRLTPRSHLDLFAWEAMYAAQFLSLEFFFRGFILTGLRKHLGVHAIWVMIVPYCMIHFGKTFAETMGAIVAGTVLGSIALRTRSIWGGVFIHVAVAWSMDLLAMRFCKGLACPGL